MTLYYLNAVLCNCIIPCIFKIYHFLISYESDCLSIEQSTTKVICVKRIVEKYRSAKEGSIFIDRIEEKESYQNYLLYA